MRLAIMQPYLFPYVGYFQLMHAVDRFVVYDDVQFIKGGWINRNSVWANGKRLRFTVPLRNGSPNERICDVELSPKGKSAWWRKFRKTLLQSYSAAPHVDRVVGMLDEIMGAGHTSIAALNTDALRRVRDWLGLEVEIVETSRRYENSHLSGQDRVLDICAIEGATTYINAIGGRELYSDGAFAERGIELRFLEPDLAPYDQGHDGFEPGLSILDVMMHAPPATVLGTVQAYGLVANDD